MVECFGWPNSQGALYEIPHQCVVVCGNLPMAASPNCVMGGTQLGLPEGNLFPGPEAQKNFIGSVGSEPNHQNTWQGPHLECLWMFFFIDLSPQLACFGHPPPSAPMDKMAMSERKG